MSARANDRGIRTLTRSRPLISGMRLRFGFGVAMASGSWLVGCGGKAFDPGERVGAGGAPAQGGGTPRGGTQGGGTQSGGTPSGGTQSGGTPSGGTQSGGAGTGGGGGGAGLPNGGGGAGIAPVDPSESAKYRWEACGKMAATRRSVKFARALAGSHRAAIVYDDGEVALEKEGEITPTGVVVQNVDGDIAFSADGSKVAELSSRGALVSELSGSGVKYDLLTGAGCLGGGLRFSVDGNYLVSWGASEVCGWEVATRLLIRRVPLAASSAAISRGRLAVATPPSAITGTALHLVTLPAGPEVSVPLALPRSSSIEESQLVVSPTGSEVMTVSLTDSGVVGRLWSDTGTLERELALSDPDSPVVFSPSGRALQVGNQTVDLGAKELRAGPLESARSSNDWQIEDDGAAALRVWSTWGFRSDIGMLERIDLRAQPQRRLIGTAPVDWEASTIVASPDGTGLAAISLRPSLALYVRIAANFAESVPMRLEGAELPLDASFSPDGRELTVSGDGWARMVPGSVGLLETRPPSPDILSVACTFTPARYSTSGHWFAVGDYGPRVTLRSGTDASPGRTFETPGCNVRVAFNADDSLMATTGRALFRTQEGSRVWPARIEPMNATLADAMPLEDVQFVGDRIVASKCTDYRGTECNHVVVDPLTGAAGPPLAGLSNPRVAASPEAHWLISGSSLLHLPTGNRQTLNDPAAVSTFMPNGDIIAAQTNGDLVRYCRTPRAGSSDVR